MTREIVHEAAMIAKAYIPGDILEGMEVNYACIFCQSQEELNETDGLLERNGSLVLETGTGMVFTVRGIDTDYGEARLVKISIPDATRKERGDVDFTVRDWEKFREFSEGREGFVLIELGKGWNVIAYFSRPALAEVIGIAELK